MTRILFFTQLLLSMFLLVNTTTSVANESTEINGLILDRTITQSGHDFYQQFSAHWLAANFSQKTNLVISEKPSARWGSSIVISSLNYVLFRTSIRPGRQLPANLIQQSAATVSKNILTRVLGRRGSRDMALTGY